MTNTNSPVFYFILFLCLAVWIGAIIKYRSQNKKFPVGNISGDKFTVDTKITAGFHRKKQNLILGSNNQFLYIEPQYKGFFKFIQPFPSTKLVPWPEVKYEYYNNILGGVDTDLYAFHIKKNLWQNVPLTLIIPSDTATNLLRTAGLPLDNRQYK